MKKSIIAGTILLLAIVTVGSILSINHPLLLFGTMTFEYDAIRLALIVLLMGLLFSAPPRSIPFRVILGAVAGTLLIGSVIMMMNYQIGILDAVLFGQVALIFAIEAAEAYLTKPVVRKIPVRMI